MKKNIILIVITILFLSCSDNEIIPEVIIPEQSTPTTRSVGDGKYDALGFGYNCFYSNFSNPLYAKAQVIDLQKLEAGIGTDQLTGKKFIEVGCGRGEFLGVLKEFPVQAFGIEHKHDLVESAQKEGINVREEFLGTADNIIE